MFQLLPVIILLLPLIVHGDVFQYQTPKGIVYSDHPPTGGYRQLPTTTVATQNLLPRTLPNLASNKASRPQSIPKKLITITSPHDQQSFWNEREIIGNIAVQPTPSEGEIIQIKVDGQNYQQLDNKLQFQLKDLDRGFHTIQATLLTQGGEMMAKSDPIKIYIHYGTTNMQEEPMGIKE